MAAVDQLELDMGVDKRGDREAWVDSQVDGDRGGVDDVQAGVAE